jgi:16S rRNA G1207 methylase RsmC
VLREFDLTPTLERLFASTETIATDDRYVVLCAAQ